MNPYPDHGINDPDMHNDQHTPGLPSVEGLLAASLALMTGHAQGCCDKHRELMTKKIIANLSMLSRHPMASAGFQAMATELHALWVRQLQQLQSYPTQLAVPAQAARPEPRMDAGRDRALWHTTPETIQ
jgi:hypothetical protein